MFFYAEWGVKNIYSSLPLGISFSVALRRCSSSLARMPLILVTLLSTSSHPIALLSTLYLVAPHCG